MKKLILLLSAFAALAFVSCSKDDNTEPPFVVCPHGTRVSFETTESLMDVNGDPLVLGDSEVVYGGVTDHSPKNIFWPKALAYASGQTDEYNQIYWQGPFIYSADGLVSLGGYYNNGIRWNGAISDTWGGFALSKNADMIAKSSKVSNQFSVWATGGANNTETFAVAYDSNSAGAAFMPPIEYNAPQIDFSSKISPYRIFIANSTFTYAYFAGIDTGKLTVKITGWNDEVEGKSVTCVLIDGAAKVSGWIDVDLSSLGAVNKLTFKVESNDEMAPFYFCLDDLCFDK